MYIFAVVKIPYWNITQMKILNYIQFVNFIYVEWKYWFNFFKRKKKCLFFSKENLWTGFFSTFRKLGFKNSTEGGMQEYLFTIINDQHLNTKSYLQTSYLTSLKCDLVWPSLNTLGTRILFKEMMWNRRYVANLNFKNDDTSINFLVWNVFNLGSINPYFTKIYLKVAKYAKYILITNN